MSNISSYTGGSSSACLLLPLFSHAQFETTLHQSVLHTRNWSIKSFQNNIANAYTSKLVLVLLNHAGYSKLCGLPKQPVTP